MLFLIPIGMAFSGCTNAYCVNFMVNGRIYKSVQVQPGESIGRIDDPEKDGYVFEGWYFSESQDAQKFNFEASQINSNVTLYAKWSKNNYTIVYKNMEDATNHPNNPTSYSVETPTFSLNNPTKDNFVFEGWHLKQDFSDEKVTTIYAGTTGDLLLYANWLPVSYNITYVLNGGYNDEKNPSNYNPESIIRLAPPVRDFYNFEGWYLDSEFSNGPVNTITLGSSGDKTFYAKWSIIEYTITYNLNNGTNDLRNPSSYTNKSLDITIYDAEKANYEFLGWYNEEGEKITEIPEGSSGNLVLEAVFEPILYSIVYHNTEGATIPSTNPIHYTVESPTLTLANPTRTAYIFQGWYTNEQMTGQKITQIVAGSSGKIDLFAKWDAYNYSINYVLNGGINNEYNPATFTVVDVVPLLAPTKEGYSFDGWYLRSDFVGDPIDKIAYGTHEAITIYAKWSINS